MTGTFFKFFYWTVGICVFIGLFFVYNTRSASYDQNFENDLFITQSGTIKNSESLSLGHASPEKNTTEIRIAIPDNFTGLVTVSLPEPLNSQDFSASIHSIQGVKDMQIFKEETKVTVSFPYIIPESHTVLILQFPQSYFSSSLTMSLNRLFTNLNLMAWLGFIVLEFFAVLLYFYLRRAKNGTHTAASTNTPPENLSPVELAVLLHGKISAQEITSLIYILASKGLLEIIGTEQNVHFLRTSKDSHLQPYEDEFLTFLAPQHGKPHSLSELIDALTVGNIFSSFVTLIYLAIYESLNKKGYFKENIRSLHLRFKTIGIIIQFIGLLITLLAYLGNATSQPGPLLFGFSTFLTGYIIYYGGYNLVPLSKKGEKATEQAMAFKQFLTDIKPISNSNQGELFFSYLPYALVFNEPERWLNRFRNSHFPIPSWLTLSTADIFRPDIFVNQINKIAQSLSKAFIKVKDPNVD